MLIERRHCARSAFMADVLAQLDGKAVTLFVYDLSMDGCMIQTTGHEVREGQVVVLEFDALCTAAGTILWRRNLTAGLQFETRLKPAAVARLVEAAAGGPYAEFAIPKLDRAALKRKVDPRGSDFASYRNSRGAKSAR